MKKVVLLLVAIAFFNVASSGPVVPRSIEVIPPEMPAPPASFGHLVVYDSLKLDQFGLKKDVFELALRGWQKMGETKPVLSIVDLSQPSTNKRLYVIDLQKKQLLFNTYVAHGQNSGDLVASKFSNVNASFQTSLGFYQTLNTYMGKHGLSLQLKGLEKGVNDQVYNRNIVLHGADYACEDFIKKNGRLGRSQGCPAVPYADSKRIIPVVKGGTCLFVYAPNPDYIAGSAFLANPYTSL